MKKGDEVNFLTSDKTRKVGEIIGTVKAGEIPDWTKKAYKDLHKRGLSQAKSRDKKSFLIVSEGQLYWPKIIL